MRLPGQSRARGKRLAGVQGPSGGTRGLGTRLEAQEESWERAGCLMVQTEGEEGPRKRAN